MFTGPTTTGLCSYSHDPRGGGSVTLTHIMEADRVNAIVLFESTPDLTTQVSARTER